MEDLRRAIYHETFLQMYDKWQIGKYYSSRGILKIEDMSISHLQNAIEHLKVQHKKRTEQMMTLISDGAVIEEIQNAYQCERDVLSIKKRELERELSMRDYTE